MKRSLLVITFSFIPFVVVSAQKPASRNISIPTVWSASQSWFTINNVTSVFRNDGHADRDFISATTGNSGFLFPKRTNRSVVFDAGVMWTAKLRDTFYVGGSNYESGLQPGRVLSPGVAENPALPKNRVYRVRPDYATASFVDESQIENKSVEQIASQYALDWLEWPASEGAPFQDKNNNGIYEPTIDIPGKPGSDQTIWYVANDLDTLLPYPEQSRRRKAMGVELQVTIWGYNRTGVLGNVMFRQYRLVNKSLVPFDSMYVMQWSDPDLGDAGDDFAGCDTTLHLGYAYNGEKFDSEYYPLQPPSVGYQFLNFPMTSSIYEAVYSTFQFWPTYRHGEARYWNNLMRGLFPYGGAFVHPLFPNPTRFWLDGDPVTGTGRLDGVISSPSDRRIGSSVGPFRLLPNEPKDIVVGSFAAMGSNRISSVGLLKRYAQTLRSMFPAIASSMPVKCNSVVSYPIQQQAAIQLLVDGRPAKALSVATQVLRQTGEVVSALPLFDDGLHGDERAGDGIWGNRITVNREQTALYVNATTIDSAGRTFTWERIHDNITVAGTLRLTNPRVFSDNINNDGIVNPRENVRYGFSAVNNTVFPLGGILFSPPEDEPEKFIGPRSMGANGFDSLRYRYDDASSYFTFTSPETGAKVIPLSLSDSNYNRWYDTLQFAVTPFSQIVYGTPLNHISGNTEWQFNIRVADPGAVLNHQYEITLADSFRAGSDTTFPIYTKVINLRDATTGDTVLRRQPLPDEYGHNIPVTAGFKVVRGADFGHVGLRRDSTRWISQFPVWLRGDRFYADPHAAFDGGATTGFMLGIFYLASVQSNFDPSRSYAIEIRFNAAQPQKAYRLRRIGSYFLQDYVNVPFTAWDVRSRATPRQLAVAWRDNNNSGTWDPVVSSSNVEIVFIYNKTYNLTGGQFTTEPNNATMGANADIVYGLSLAVRTGHVLNESPGTLYLRPTLAPTSDDRFTFNPTIGAPPPELPKAYVLYQNYPNPFNPMTTIKYELPLQSRVAIKIFNLLGQEVKILADRVETAGEHTVRWDGRNNIGLSVASGVYFYRIEARSAGNTFMQVKKMMLLR